MNSHIPRKKVEVSYVICDEDQRRHRSGVNSLRYDAVSARLYTAGRDSIVRIWDTRRCRPQGSGASEPPEPLFSPTHIAGDEAYINCMEHHTDWVNDIVLCCDGRTLISASSDATVKVWNSYKYFCMSTLRTHKDYVKALAYARHREQVASAGFDCMIYLWDVNTLTALTATKNTVTTSTLNENKYSIYSLAMNNCGNIIMSGSTEKVIRVWDPRSCNMLMKLSGHTDAVKSLVVSEDGTQCLSAGSDGQIKLWSLGQQRCIITFPDVHAEGIWTLQVDHSFSHVYSAGRDCDVKCTQLNNSISHLVCRETAPVLKLEWEEPNRSMFISTTDSSIKLWDIGTKVQNVGSTHSATYVIQGSAGIKNYHILNDKKHILTKDTSQNVAVWNVMTASKVEDLGKVDFEAEIKKRTKIIFVPNWFGVDLKTGLLTLHLDENDVFTSWVTSKDQFGNDIKLNLGSQILQSLLQHWPETNTYPNSDDSCKKNGESGNEFVNSYNPIPDHTLITFSEVSSITKTLFRLTCCEAAGESEHQLLNDIVPNWVYDATVKKVIPKFTKISFTLVSAMSANGKPPSHVSSSSLSAGHAASAARGNTLTPKRDRLSANEMILVRKVIEHIHEKNLPYGVEYTDTNKPDSFTVPEQIIELLCNDTVLDLNMDLRTVRHFIWKQAGDLTLYYRYHLVASTRGNP